MVDAPKLPAKFVSYNRLLLYRRQKHQATVPSEAPKQNVRIQKVYKNLKTADKFSVKSRPQSAYTVKAPNTAENLKTAKPNLEKAVPKKKEPKPEIESQAPTPEFDPWSEFLDKDGDFLQDKTMTENDPTTGLNVVKQLKSYLDQSKQMADLSAR